jgi:hypothetical protein
MEEWLSTPPISSNLNPARINCTTSMIIIANRSVLACNTSTLFHRSLSNNTLQLHMKIEIDSNKYPTRKSCIMTMPIIKSSPTVLYDYVNLNSIKMLDDICEDDANKVQFLLTKHHPRHPLLFKQLLWRWGIYIPVEWSMPSQAPVISHTLHYGVQHIMAKAWIRHPASPPDLRWHHVTKTWNRFLICCMSAQQNYHLSSSNTKNVEYVNDILFVKMENGQPTDSHPSDIETIIDFLRRPHEVSKMLSTSPCTSLIIPFDHVLENCLSITNDAWINNTSNVCLISLVIRNHLNIIFKRYIHGPPPTSHVDGRRRAPYPSHSKPKQPIMANVPNLKTPPCLPSTNGSNCQSLQTASTGIG